MILKGESYVVETFKQFRERLGVSDDELIDALDASERADILEIYRDIRADDPDEPAPPDSLADLSELELHEGIWHELGMDETRMIQRVLAERHLPYTHLRDGPLHRIVEVDPELSDITIDDEAADGGTESDEIDGPDEPDNPSVAHAFAALEDLREFFRAEGMSDEQHVINEAHALIQEYQDAAGLGSDDPSVSPDDIHVVSTSRDDVWLVSDPHDGDVTGPEQACAYVQGRIDPDGDEDADDERVPWTYYDGTLDQPLRSIAVDGVATLNP